MGTRSKSLNQAEDIHQKRMVKTRRTLFPKDNEDETTETARQLLYDWHKETLVLSKQLEDMEKVTMDEDRYSKYIKLKIKYLPKKKQHTAIKTNCKYLKLCHRKQKTEIQKAY